MRSKWARIGWLIVLITAASAGTAIASSSLFGTSFNVGDEVRFKVEDAQTWWWGCCSCCDESVVLGWRVVNTAGQVVYSVIHDAPVASSIWQGSWLQLDMNGQAVAAGSYKLVVDTSAGTLSRCFSIKDPCGCNWCTSCTSCPCEDVPSISDCACRTTLVFVENSDCFGCFPLFWWGCCSSGSSCSSCP